MKSGKCLQCQELVSITKKDRVGDIIYCSHCDAELEIIKVSPLQFDWPLEEDFDDDDGYAYIGDYEDEEWGDYEDD